MITFTQMPEPSQFATGEFLLIKCRKIGETTFQLSFITLIYYILVDSSVINNLLLLVELIVIDLDLIMAMHPW
jgi:hypothetical protein